MQHIFVHIPKTAGQTLTPILVRQFTKEERLYFYEEKHESIKEKIEAFKNYTPQQQAKLKLLMGHFPFGLHQYNQDQPFTYLTFLRDPIKRVISHYNYVKNLDHHYLHAYNGIMDSLDAYVNSKKVMELDNGQLRLITDNEDVPFGECTQDMLEEGIKIIDEHFSFVGLTEYFMESILLLQAKYDFKNVSYVNRNVSSKKKKAISETDKKAIVKYNELDIQLYEYCKNRVLKEVAAIENLEEKRALLERANKRYTTFFNTKNRLKTFVKSMLPKNRTE